MTLALANPSSCVCTAEAVRLFASHENLQAITMPLLQLLSIRHATTATLENFPCIGAAAKREEQFPQEGAETGAKGGKRRAGLQVC